MKIQKAKKENSFIERNSTQFVAVDPTHTTITSERIDPNIYYSRSPLPRKPPLKVVSKTFFTMDNLALITQSTGLLSKGEEISEEDRLPCLPSMPQKYGNMGCGVFKPGYKIRTVFS